MDADGSNVSRLTNGADTDTFQGGQFSPDGTKIAYEASTHGVGGPVVVMNADGTNPETIVEADVLGFSWQPKQVRPAPERGGAQSARDIGLDFNVCFPDRLGGIDFLGDGTNGSAWTGVPVTDDGTCARHARPSAYILAIDDTGDQVADSWIELPFDCSVDCAPFDATDLDANGSEELVVTSFLSVMDYYFFSVRPNPAGDLQVEPILVAEPGHKPAGITAGLPLRIDAGGDEGYGSSIDCEAYPTAPVIVWSWSNGPVESQQPTDVHITRIQLQEDGRFHVVGTNDFTVPADQSSGIAHEAPACGVDWHPSA
jgi:hypothetical protein